MTSSRLRRGSGQAGRRIYQLLHFPLRGAGAGIYALNLAERLAARGFDVRTLRAGHAPAATTPPGDVVLFHREGDDGPADLDFDFPVFVSHPESSGSRFGELTDAQYARYRRVFRETIARGIERFRPDVIHVHHGWVIAAIVAELGVPYVVTLHGSERQAFAAFPAYRELTLRGLAGARRVTAVSAEVAEHAIRTYDLSRAAVTVVPSGVDTATFRPRALDRCAVLARLGVQDTGGPIVLFAGRLIAIKGVDVLLRAAARYERLSPRPITLVAGTGSETGALRMLARELKLQSVQFLGQQPHDAMPALYDAAEVAVVPSREDAMPLTALEALACGTPVVASAVGGLRDLPADGVARLVAPDDAAALAAAIEDLLQRNVKARCRETTAQVARTRFSFERTVDATIDIYRAAMAAAERQPACAA